MNSQRVPGPGFLVSPVAGFAAFAVYFYTLAPSYGWLDSGELIAAARVLGIPHPPGATTWVLLAHAFSWIPLGTVEWRINLVSAVSAAVAVGLVASIVRRLVRGSDPEAEGAEAAALAAAGIAAFSLSLWTLATIAEVYPLYVTLLLASLRWTVGYALAGSRRSLLLAGLSLGLAVTLRPTAVVWGLAGFGWLLSRGRVSIEMPGLRTRPKDLVFAALAAGVGLLPWVLLPLRTGKTPIEFSDLSGPFGFVRTVTGLAMSDRLSAPVGEVGMQLPRMLSAVPSELGWIGAALAAGGLAVSIRRAHATSPGVLLLLLLLAETATLVLLRPFGRGLQHYGLAAWMLASILAGLAFAAAWTAFPKRFLRATLGLAVAVQAALSLGENWSSANRRTDWAATDFARAALAQAGGASTIFCRDDDSYCALVAAQAAGTGLTTKVLHAGHVTRWMETQKEIVFPVFPQGGWFATYRDGSSPEQWTSDGVLFRFVGPNARDWRVPHNPNSPAFVVFGGTVRLGQPVLLRRFEGTRMLVVGNRWLATRAIGMDFTVVTVFVDSDGNVPLVRGEIAFHDTRQLQAEGKPLNALAPNEWFEERRLVPIPSDLPPGEYRLAVAIARARTVEAAKWGSPRTPETIYGRGNEVHVRRARSGKSEGMRTLRLDTGGSPDFLPVESDGAAPGSLKILDGTFALLTSVAIVVPPDPRGFLGISQGRAGIEVRAVAVDPPAGNP